MTPFFVPSGKRGGPVRRLYLLVGSMSRFKGTTPLQGLLACLGYQNAKNPSYALSGFNGLGALVAGVLAPFGSCRCLGCSPAVPITAEFTPCSSQVSTERCTSAVVANG